MPTPQAQLVPTTSSWPLCQAWARATQQMLHQAFDSALRESNLLQSLVSVGVPNGTDDEKRILLGDVIISDGLIEYNLGRQFPNKFVRKDTLQDSLGRPNIEIRALLAKLKGNRGRMRLKENTFNFPLELQKILGAKDFQYPSCGCRQVI